MAKEEKVGMRIKMYRDKLKMTLGDLSAKSGIPVATIASIEDGEVLPALGVLTKLSRSSRAPRTSRARRRPTT